MRKSNELQIGKAGEYITCADLIMKGLIAYPSEQGLPYDILIDTGIKLLKCQVKTTEKPRVVPQRNKETNAYIFSIKRHGKNNQQIYNQNEVDVFALVELENRTVAYLINEEMPTTVNFRVDRLRGTYYDEKGLSDYKSVIDLFSSGLSQTKISQQTGIQLSIVNKMCQPDYKPFKTKARYFSDYYRSADWFKTL